jgi:hypothetical protein
MQENEERTVLCGASSYEQKYYFNEEFSALPQRVKDELKVLCVMYVEEVGGVLTLEYEPDGELEFKVTADEADYLFDDIGSALKIKEIRRDKSDLLESLEMYYKVFWLNEE